MSAELLDDTATADVGRRGRRGKPARNLRPARFQRSTRNPAPAPALVPELSPAWSTTLAILMLLAAVALWAVFYALVLSGLQEHRTQRSLYDSLREELAAETAPVGGVIKDGAPIATLTVPALGLNRAVVAEGTTSTDLERGPGHRVDTVFPGQAGVSVIFGKSATFGAPFAKLTSLKPGAVITATTGQGTFIYHVIDVRTPGMPFPAPVTGTAGRLILVSAYGHGWRSGWAPSQVVYVDADLQGAGKTSPGGGPAAQPANQVALARDDTALTPLVLWLELLIVAAVGFVWARRHWGGWQVWLVGAPALFAVVWLVTETAARLLPNLL